MASKSPVSIVELSKEQYVNELSWVEFFRLGKNLENIRYDESWAILFAIVKKNPKFMEISKKLRDLIIMNNKLKIYPLPTQLFWSFLATPADEIKVVFLGQDPYFNCEYHDREPVPQATGLSFSVANNMKIPSSLDNIFNNLLKYGHIKKKPKNGNLWFWAMQGCLMLNTALTVEDGQKKSHSGMWEWFSDLVIKYISDNMDGIIFALWGADAYAKASLIDLDRHHITVSSHPSGFSVNNPFRNFPAFANCDHFGTINKLLKQMNKEEILWD